MLNEAELRIISAFFPEGIERATKEIEDRSGYSHERAYSTLKTLEEKGVLSKKKVGKALVYSIKKFDDMVYLSFAYHSLNRKDRFIKKYSSVWGAIEEFINKTKLEMVVLFGSYSKDEAKEKSDVDLLCVNGNSETEKIALSLRHKYNLRMSTVIVRKEDFQNIKSENPELWDDLIKFGVVLKGQELFYDLVYRWNR
ncbi:MAG: nucleotidyltransferase domain-containing protein [Methanocellales archaeon]|nr:nucleotidyltransferase domain-containing protein [Methanocellales archaeon]